MATSARPRRAGLAGAFKLLAISLFLLLWASIRGSNQSGLHKDTRRNLLERPHDQEDQCRTVESQQERCLAAKIYCGGGSESFINYSAIHSCLLAERSGISVPFLITLILLAFYVLSETAEQHFSAVVARMAALLRLSPSMGGVTILALGNGAPDVFASIAAVYGGNARVGFSAILSGGAFVSAFVVGFVALAAAPFSLDPFCFTRDVSFYFVAVALFFAIYLTGKIYLWQALGLVAFYFVFVFSVFCMDQIMGRRSRTLDPKSSDLPSSLEASIEIAVPFSHSEDNVPASTEKSGRDLIQVLSSLVSLFTRDLHFCSPLAKIGLLWQLPVEVALRVTIPSIDPVKWNPYYTSSNFIFCPLVLLYICRSVVSPSHKIVFLIPTVHFSLWTVVLVQGIILGAAHFIAVKEPPEKEQPLAVVTAFVMSVFWISFIAGELLGCLAALGLILEIPPYILGLTVLAWGNSIGDLVADVAVAKAGQPAMAMAGCFAGPMFNMLIGLGLALSLQCAQLHPSPYRFEPHYSIIIAFCFLFTSLLGSLLVISWSRFQVSRAWGFTLIGLYVTFVIVSISAAKII